jgi:hypothetical protein
MSNVHVNPNFKAAAAAAAAMADHASSVHINPNFKASSSTPTVHVNPNFKSSTSATPVPHINPNFSNRPLPAVPPAKANDAKAHINPAFITRKADLIDPTKQKEYDEAVVRKAAAAMAAVAFAKQNKTSKVYVNPKFGNAKSTYIDPNRKKVVSKKCDSSPNSSEKENSSPGSSRKTVFKKIGTKKLVRISSKPKKTMVATIEVQQARSTPFRKIGTRKLIRLQSRNTAEAKSPKTAKHHFVYKVKTSRKIVKTPKKTTPPPPPPSVKRTPGFLMSRLVTPLSLRRRTKHTPSSPGKLSKSYNGSHLLNRVLKNPFKVDRRMKKKKAEEEREETPKLLPPPPPPPMQTPKSIPPPKPARKQPSAHPAQKQASEAIVNIDGVKFKVSENGKKLNRMETASSRGVSVRCSVSRKLYVEGEEYVEAEEEPGVLVRSRNSMTRASITNARNRSINTIIKSQTRSKQYCMFFNKFGKCNKREKGVCPYIHDQEKVAVCRKFLAGNCRNEKCLLSHKVGTKQSLR